MVLFRLGLIILVILLILIIYFNRPKKKVITLDQLTVNTIRYRNIDVSMKYRVPIKYGTKTMLPAEIIKIWIANVEAGQGNEIVFVRKAPRWWKDDERYSQYDMLELLKDDKFEVFNSFLEKQAENQ